jgi:hypothetical protein
MTAVDACHPAFTEHERVTDRLDIIQCQVLVIYTIEEYVGEYAEAILDSTRSAVVSMPSTGLLTKRLLSWDEGRISVHTRFSAAPDKAQKGPSRSKTWNNSQLNDDITKRANGGGPDIPSLRTLAIQKRVLRGSPRQTGRFCYKNRETSPACGACFGVFRSLYGTGKTQQDI